MSASTEYRKRLRAAGDERYATYLEQHREAQRRYRNKRRDEGCPLRRPSRARAERPREPIAFVALDGEGVTDADGAHHYVLMGCSDGAAVEEYEPGGLTTRACFDFVLDAQARHPRARLVGFGFGYDCNMMFRDVSRERLERIAAGEVTTLKLGSALYRVRYIAGKSLYLARGRWEAQGDRQRVWRGLASARIWDVLGFFQISFVSALRAWGVGDPALVDEIAAMKDARGTFTRRQRKAVRVYCLRECRLLVGLMDRLASTLAAAEIFPTRWDGAGAVASALLGSHGVRPHLAKPDREKIDHAVMSAYFGGRVERFVAGRVPDPVIQYDINSAYPAQIAALPSMAGGEWERARSYDPSAPYAVWRVRWNVRRPKRITRPGRWALAPFPFRDDRHILWPTCGEGFYHAAEVRAAFMLHGAAIDVLDGYVFRPASDDRPFGWVPEMYEARRAYKEAGDPRHIVLKLGLNSLYGKLAQGVGARDQAPPYQCYFLAGMITAGCRATMLSAAALADPAALVAIATDGLYVRGDLPLDCSPALGAWDRQEIEAGLLVVQAGVMISPSRSYVKTRGSAARAVAYDRLLAAWRADGFGASVTADETRFIGCSYALHVGDLDRWRRWIAMERRIRFAPAPRKWPRFAAWGATDDLEYVYPPEAEGVSAPYVPKVRYIEDVDEAAGLALMREQPDLDREDDDA